MKKRPIFYLSALLFAAAVGLGMGPAQIQAQEEGTADPDRLREIYADWTVECLKTAESAQQVCRMAQVLRGENKRPVFSTFIQRDFQESAALLTMVTPFGVNLSEVVTVAVDDESIVEAGYSTCRRMGCFVQKPVEQTVVEAMRAGDSAVASITFINGRKANFRIPLSGFSAAWTRLGELK